MKIMNGYKNDLGTGLQTGDEIGCHSLTGLTLKNKNRYQCFLKLGTSPEDKPWIEMFNYEEIPAGTLITIMFTGLTTIAGTKWTYTYAGIRVYYKETYGIVQYYDLVNDISDVQVTPLTVNTYTGNAEVSGSKYVNEFSNYTFKFTLTNTIKGNTATDFLKIKFPRDAFNKLGDTRIPSCSLGKVFVMGSAHTIYLQPTSDLSGLITLNLNNLENPQYQMSAQTMNVFIQEIVDNQLHNKFTFNVIRETISCESFTTFSVSVNQSTGGLNNVTYEITIKTGHKIPNEGYFKINLPEDYGKLSILGVTCKLENFGKQTSCNVNTYTIEVFFNGDSFNESQTYKIYLNGMNNPNVKMDLKSFYIYSVFSQTNSTQIICSTKTNAPTISLSTINNCSLQVSINEATAKSSTDYNFAFICQTNIRENSEIQLILPEVYKSLYQSQIKQTATQSKIFICKSDNLYFLRDDNCIMISSGNNIIITAKVNGYSANTPLNIIIKQLINPSPSGRVTGFYVECKSMEIAYAKSQKPALIIISSNDYQITSQDQKIHVRLQNIPISAGQPASYIFSLDTLEITASYIFTSVNIQFSDYFEYGVSDDLECGAFLSNSNQTLAYDDALELFYNSNTTFIALPCTVNERKVLITKVNDILKNKTTQYINWVVRNVINPSQQTIHELTIEYASGTVDIYKLTDNFTITLSLGPSELYLSERPYLNTYNIKNYAYYRFYVQLTNDLVSQQKLGIMIKFPNSYKEVQSFQNRSNFYCDSSLNSILGKAPDCKFYGNNILITLNQSLKYNIAKQVNNYSFDIILSEMLNPLRETSCSSNSTSLNSQFQFYQILLINLETGHIISRNYQANDKKNCIEFVKDLYEIKIVGEKKVQAGFSYLLTIILEQPYDGILLIPTVSCQNHRISFNTSSIQFNDFVNDRQSILMIVDKGTQPGSYQIQWEKRETKHQIAFMEVLDTAILVLNSNEQKSMPKILIELINVIGVKMKFDISVTLEQPPSFKLCLNSQFDSQNNKWLRNILSISPQQLCFEVGQTQKYFTLYSKLELNSQILKFSLTPSDAYKIYNLTETERQIYIEDKPSNQQNCYIFSIASKNITKNNACLNVLVSEQSKIYYILAYKNSPAPNQQQLVNFQYNYSIINGINHTILPTTMLQQSSNIINLTKLEAATKYTLFCIARGRHSYSQIYTYNFETQALSNGALLRFQLNNQNISDITLLTAFSKTLCLPLNRFLITSKHNFDKPINKSLMNERPAIYEVLITPSQVDDYKMPIEYANMLDSSYYYKKLKKQLPEIKDDLEYVVDELKIAEEPKMVLVTYYNATISIRFWKQAKVYAVRECEDIGMNKLRRQKLPLSQQIYKGFDQENKKQNVTKYYTFEGITDYYGKINIFFDDLKAEKECTIYITGGTFVPFDPPKLLADEEVRSITFQTPKNQNLAD